MRGINENDLLSALELCNLLMVSDCIVYDGNVYKNNISKLEQYLDKIERGIGKDTFQLLQNKLIPVIPRNKCEEAQWMDRSIEDSFSYFTVIIDTSSELIKCLPPYGSDDAEFTKTIQVIEQYINESPKKILASGILGKRFFYSAFSNHKIKEYISSRLNMFTENVWRVMFNRFRIDFAKHRASNANKIITQLQNNTVYYYPTVERRKLLYLLTDKLKIASVCEFEEYEKKTRNLKIYSSIEDDIVNLFCEQSQVLPLTLKVALLDSDFYDNPSGLTLLSASLKCSYNKPPKLHSIIEATKEFNTLNNIDKKECFKLIETFIQEPKIKGLRDKRALRIGLGALWDFVWGNNSSLFEKPIEMYKHIRKFESGVVKTAIQSAESLKYLRYSEGDCGTLLNTFGAPMMTLMSKYIKV
ncbi:MAG: hypothetical protein PHY02_07735 [Phycisphaerae bacterium]|nr:hypothetical protein [Phycisphaerae bacterium]